MKQQPTQQDQQDYFAGINAKLKAEIRSNLSKIPFPLGQEEFKQFKEVTKNLMTNISMNDLKADLQVWQALKSNDFNLFSFTFVLNAITSASPKDLGIDLDEYEKLVEAAYKMGQKHTELAKPVQDKAQDKYQKIVEKRNNEMMVEANKQQKKEGAKVIPFKHGKN